ncbi:MULTISPECIES: response regulator transcription factor [unclassified Pseudoclavibacter]|uniref:response regulator transcription factor n=1 Tax=unclassified Pseudoclavibacter TaxID=2615177 RepID=UPI0013012A7D|nr:MULTISPECIES: response regulator transcription factor [unclassified Pseudoclavibacter]KAB1647270.1 response regulator transcription factor [Pseudoclavibacter sp. CFCC 14310]KAB1657606.1 response regulator transcription factor [Pseudoclavibacter sp. CFCC 11306]KAB1660518.1 response regulator transcription factor [Pseudoclavibacter sp. CFCC 13796]KAB1662737.1 response regulator transcription factor [Pseudoclavibacter sp. CFCC 13611]
MTHLLLVEDAPSISEPLTYLLRREGYEVTVAHDGLKALEAFAQVEPDLILLDLMLPGMNGLDVCRQIRQTSDVPVIMLTAKDTELDTVLGLEVGADDYVTKPYSSQELLARVRAVLRRSGGADVGGDEITVIEAGGIRIDLDSHVVSVEGGEVYLPLKEFELLAYLAENVGRVLTRGQLIDQVWGPDYFGDTKTLDVHVKRIRSKIEKDPKHPQRLVTVRGLGYKLEA